VLLALAAAVGAGAVLVWLTAFVVPAGRALDEAAMRSFGGVARPPLTPSIRGVAVLADPLPFLLAAITLVAIGLLRRRLLMAAVVPAVLIAANACTQLLKPGLARPRLLDLAGIGEAYPASWPSGHSTAAMSLALCLVLVVGPQLRPLAALLGAAYAIGVGYALVALGWHLPSDVLGGYLVAAIFALLGAAVLAGLERRRPALARCPRETPASDWPMTAAAGAALAAITAGAALGRHPALVGDTLRHPSALLAACAIAALGLALTAGLALVLRR
jgi:membrane-associated phospholipid phosphatase